MKGISEIIDKYATGNFLRKIGLKIIFNISADIVYDDVYKQMIKFLSAKNIKYNDEILREKISKIILNGYILKATEKLETFIEFGSFIQTELVKLQKEYNVEVHLTT